MRYTFRKLLSLVLAAALVAIVGACVGPRIARACLPTPSGVATRTHLFPIAGPPVPATYTAYDSSTGVGTVLADDGSGSTVAGVPHCTQVVISYTSDGTIAAALATSPPCAAPFPYGP